MSEAFRSIIVASYNIHRCIGVDRRLNPDCTAEVIREIGADIIALQEVDARHHARGYLDQWQYLADALGYTCIPGISIRTHRNEYGNALMSRLPIQAVRLHDLSFSSREPRGAIDVDIALAGSTVRVIATHLGLTGPERRNQADCLLRHIAEIPASAVVLLGDLNEWRWVGGSISKLVNAFTPSPRKPATFPTRYPLLPLDRILVRGNLHMREIHTHRSAKARKASDHLPIYAKLDWNDSPAGAH